MNNTRKKVFVMLSGGVDSSVAAALLKERCFDVVGVFMKNWSGPASPASQGGGEYCPVIEDEGDARRVAAKLVIPFYVLNFEKEYWRHVFEPFLEEIRRGGTPNPDVFCNEYIKFGVFLDRALTLGADFVATGHYARLRREITNHKSQTRALNFIKCSAEHKTKFCALVTNKSQIQNSKSQTVLYKLLKAIDQSKDQTYFLYRLNQFQLSKTLFPIGEYKKGEVREMAKKLGLPTYNKPDSQGICFVGETPFEEFLLQYIPQTQGKIVNSRGRQIGLHRGTAFYTIGQRRGLGIGGVPAPLFVAQKDIRTNMITAVAERDPLLYAKSITIGNVHWISGKEPTLPLRCKARIRYRQEIQKCVIEQRAGSWKLEAALLKVNFSKAPRAVTPGQSIVFYQGDEVLGGGIIR
ncbi:MAG: tRNA-specific 2-thiouridylase [Candidatus Colwellbacteria bacterium]|nr:tRNA-specific 2-thiouridylase [Candidatus Colwellbacteria bacterium]